VRHRLSVFPLALHFPSRWKRAVARKTGNRFIPACGTEMKARRKEGMDWTRRSDDRLKGGGERGIMFVISCCSDGGEEMWRWLSSLLFASFTSETPFWSLEAERAHLSFCLLSLWMRAVQCLVLDDWVLRISLTWSWLAQSTEWVNWNCRKRREWRERGWQVWYPIELPWWETVESTWPQLSSF